MINYKEQIALDSQISFYLRNIIKENVEDVENKIFVDVLGGFGIISQEMKKIFKRVIVSDINSFYLPFIKARVENHVPIIDPETLVESINEIIQKNDLYNPQSHQNFFIIKDTLNQLKSHRRLKNYEYWFLYISVIESLIDSFDTNIFIYKHSEINFSTKISWAYNLSPNRLLAKIKNRKYDVLFIKLPENNIDEKYITFSEKKYYKSSYLINRQETIRQLKENIHNSLCNNIIIFHTSNHVYFNDDKYVNTLEKTLNKLGNYKKFCYNYKNNTKNEIKLYFHFLEKNNY